MTDAAIALSAIVSKNLPLVERAPGRWLGLFPFHMEQTPSFMVDDAAEQFHCLGCGARGRLRAALGGEAVCVRVMSRSPTGIEQHRDDAAQPGDGRCHSPAKSILLGRSLVEHL